MRWGFMTDARFLLYVLLAPGPTVIHTPRIFSSKTSIPRHALYSGLAPKFFIGPFFKLFFFEPVN